MKKILAVFGTRPDAIKMCPLVKAITDRKEFALSVCVTGQHRELLSQVLQVFGVSADYDLDVMEEGQSLESLTARILERIQIVLEEVKPDLVLVHGDTTTAFAASLAAYYRKIPVGHVEAGLRTYDPFSPFPEEFNRRAVSALASWHFAPTETAVSNLTREGIPSERIFLTGNTVVDALSASVEKECSDDLLPWSAEGRLILLTVHRRENLGEPMTHIFRAIRRIAGQVKDVRILYPVHPNPAVRELAEKELAHCPAIRLVEPLDVVTFHHLLSRCYLVLTDSGGIQEEATVLGRPTLVLRDVTERPEGISAGGLALVGTKEEALYTRCLSLLEEADDYAAMCKVENPYGGSGASQAIAAHISRILADA